MYISPFYYSTGATYPTFPSPNSFSTYSSYNDMSIYVTVTPL